MKMSLIKTWSYVVVLLLSTNVRAEDSTAETESRTISLLDRLQGKSWATVSSDQGGYQLRLLTDEEKIEAESIINQYRQSREQGNETEELVSTYRAMPSDVRIGRFFKVRALESGDIELMNDELEAIMPLTSVRVMLLGPTGALSSRSTFDRAVGTRSSTPSPQEFMQALRGGRTGGFNSPGVGIASSLLGATGNSNEQSREEQPPVKPTVYYLKYAEASALVNVITEVFADRKLHVAIEPRLNAVIVQSDPELKSAIETLIQSLDLKTGTGKQEFEQPPKIRAYSLKNVDARTVLQVLQTVVNGRPDVRISVDTRSNRIIVLGHDADHQMIEATMNLLDWAE